MKLLLGIKNGRLARWLASMAAIGVGTILVSACSASAAQDANTNSAAVALNPASGAESSTPTWSTHSACPAGFQGSAIFRAVRPNGTTFSISGATNTVTAPFHGTLLGTIAEIQDLSGVANGAKQKYVVICFSGDSLTGQSRQEMSLFVTYSTDGNSYKTG